MNESTMAYSASDDLSDLWPAAWISMQNSSKQMARRITAVKMKFVKTKFVRNIQATLATVPILAGDSMPNTY